MYGPAIYFRIRWWKFRLWLNDWWKVVGFIASIALVVGVWAALSSTPGLHFSVAGKCVSAPRGGVLQGHGSGFKPYENYSIDVTTSNGKPYQYYGPVNGEADALGHPSYFVWPCDDTYYSGDKDITPAGKYKVTLVMLDTNKVVTATFTVGKAPSSK